MVERKCRFCGNIFLTDTNGKKYCNEVCKLEAAKERYKKYQKIKKEEKIKIACSTLSINDIAKIGRKHNMTYGEAVAAIERGDIKV